MAQPLIKFFRVAKIADLQATQKVQGGLYFETSTGILYVYNGAEFEAYSGLKSASFADQKLVLTPSVGAAIEIDLSGYVDSTEFNAELAKYVKKEQTIAGIDLQDNITAEELKTALGLGSAAYTEASAYDVAGAAAQALADAKDYADSLPHENTTYTFAEGSVNGEFVVTPSNGTAQQVKVHGLGDAAYTTVAALESTMDSKDQAVAAAAATDAQGKADKALADAKAWVEEQKYVTAAIINGLATEEYVGNAVKAEADIARAAEKANADAIAAEKARLDAFLNEAGVGDAAVDTLKEIQEYINEHGEVAATMLQNIAANKTAIATEAATARTAESNLQTAITNEESARKAAIEAMDFNEASTGGSKVTVNVTQVDGKITGVTVAESDIASAQALATLDAEVQEHERVVAGALNDLNDRMTTAEGSVANHETRLTTAEAEIDALQAAVEGMNVGVTKVTGDTSNAFVKVSANPETGDVALGVQVAVQDGTTAGTKLATDTYVTEQAATAESNAKTYADNLMSWASF